ncbi:hypothetical protein G6O67_003017 [Ophiocordyceps sinensis]|uniref:guanosine-diphosphatase n=2 Tax=Ophiocordyceps sinensis TaxID=72228 RepID=A0A8H4PVJ5_9HYPO|nr:guanosine diphosphatase [Ophiocordyceps sinensis CO18]KAF4511197.1 hypothetical protein G6O67_003017 [Ophiocordyceps sinensis]
MRRTSVSLPTKQVARDPHEKPDRYQPAQRGRGLLSAMREVWVHHSQRTRWLRTVAVASTVLLIFWWLSPRGVEVYHGVSRVKGQMPADSTYGTDRCQKSYSKDKPIVQYALMVDAGSTGSRIHVYKFNNCGPIPELEKEEFKMTDKSVGGLSKYKDDPVAAAKSLDPLLQHALEHVPDKIKRCTPIAVKATAGLRLAGPEKSQAILDQVRRHLETEYPFPVVSTEQEGVAVMDGSLEGVYAWVTANYLLGKIGGPDKGETAAVFDLGGGSTQIVFEPTFKGAPAGGMPEKLAEGDHKYSLDFGGQKFDLYQHSHLGFGLMSARKAIHKMLISDIAAKESEKAWMAKPVVHPCIAPGMSQEIEVEMDDGPRVFKFIGPSQPAPAQCRNLAEKILIKSADCKLAPCSFNGVHQPSLGKTFAKEDVYIFSYFYDRVKPLGMPDSFTVREMHDLTQTVCMGKAGWDVFTSMPEAMEELDGRPEYCLDLNFMMALLHTGYDMPIDREVKVAKKIKGNELGWCLGASLPLLSPGSGWKCKVQQVI